MKQTKLIEPTKLMDLDMMEFKMYLDQHQIRKTYFDLCDQEFIYEEGYKNGNTEIAFNSELIEHRDIKPRFILMMLDNTIVGSLAYCFPPKNEVFIYRLFVPGNYKRNGIASKMINYLKITYPDKTLVAEVYTYNTASLNMFEKNGFKTHHRTITEDGILLSVVKFMV